MLRKSRAGIPTDVLGLDFLGNGASQRLGHTREAKRLLAEAAGWIEAASRATNVDFSDTQPAWRGWYESGLFPLLLREAEALLGENPPAS